jgi:Protein of unknown function (DUF1007)
VALKDPTDARQQWSNKRLTLHFQLPLQQPLDPRKTKIVYRVYHPSFFIDVEFAGKESISTAGSMPAGCHMELQEPVSDQQTNDTKTMLASKGVDWQAPPEEDFGIMFAQPIAVVCADPPPATAAPAPLVPVSTLSDRELVKPRNSAAKGGIAIPSIWTHPAGFILATQQSFYERISLRRLYPFRWP